MENLTENWKPHFNPVSPPPVSVDCEKEKFELFSTLYSAAIKEQRWYGRGKGFLLN